jgi:soluble lytic murein transglycosylase-like protein
MMMDKRSIIGAILSAGLWLTLAPPARGQIASYVDENGKIVYVNADPRPRPAGLRNKAAGAHASATETSAAILPDRLERLVCEIAERHSLDPALLKAVVGVESGGNPRAISRKGALGLMQLVPTTAERFGVGNAFDPAQNLEGGASYLRQLLDRYDGDLTKSLAAYNAGEGAVQRFGGVPNYPETRAYVQKVTNTYFRSGSDRLASAWGISAHPIRKTVDDKGRIVFTNE